MSYNGSGQFLINSTGQPVVANTVISATVFNALTADLATGLSTAITKDGQTTITANIPFGNNKITGLAAGTAATDSANLGQVQSTAAKLITVTGTDTITGSMSPALTAYAAGQLFYFVAAGANTGAVTINIDGLGAKSITRDGATALANGDINSGEVVVLVYDGTRFQMINAANSFGNTTINGTLTVTGNTGLQANVSITSALSVGGTFNVTGAAALGSTLSVTGKSDLPTVSTASMNAAVALITTGTVTNLTATGASIASANIGNLQFTAASIASINAGVAVITNLTATSASIASANVGTAVITTGTVTNLTSTSASIASANAAVALVTTGTVTNLTSTSASIASANVGTAVVTGLTVTGASIASVNVGAAVLSGNLTLNGGTANGVLYLNGSKVATSGSALTFDGTNLGFGGNLNSTLTSEFYLQSPAGTNFVGINQASGYVRVAAGSVEVLRLSSTAAIFNLSGVEQMRLTSTGLGIGTTSPAQKLEVAGNAKINGNIGTDLQTISSWAANARALQLTTFGEVSSNDNLGNISVSSNAYESSDGSWKRVAATSAGLYQISYTGAHTWSYTGSGAGDSTITWTTAMTLDSSGNLGLGVTPSAWGTGNSIRALQLNSGALWNFSNSGLNLIQNGYYDGSDYKYVASAAASQYSQSAGAHSWNIAASGTAGNTITFTTAMQLNASGGLQCVNTVGVGNATPSTSGAGITFPATQSASSNANTLDDYEEGTWQGSFSPGTSGTITINTSDDTGAYTKIGRQVTVTGNFQITSVASPVGGLVLINGLPFAIGDGTETSQRGSGSVMYYDNSVATAYVRPVDYIETESSFRVWLDASTVEANDSFTFTVTYFV